MRGQNEGTTNSRPIKVLLGLSQLGVGGLELQALALCKGLDKKKFDLYCVPLWPNLDLIDDFRKADVNVILIHKKRSFDLLALFRLTRFLRNEKIDIVHTWIFTANTWIRLAAVLAGVPVIIAAERNVDLWKNFIHRVIDKLLAIPTDLIIGNSKAVKDFIISEGIPERKCKIIYNGLDSKLFFRDIENKEEIKINLQIPLDKIVIGTLANFRPQKDYPNFLKVAKIVSENRENVHFIACGSGQEKNFVISGCHEMGLDNEVTFIESRRDVQHILGLMDIFILTSKYEGFSNSILEAMASSLPVVATNVGGNAESIVSGKTGFIVPSRDPESMASAIIKLIDNTELRKKFGEAGCERVENLFSMQTMIDSYSDIYASLLQKKKGK